MCLSDDRGLAGNVMREAADALAALQKAIGLADAKLAFAMVYAADAAAADHAHRRWPRAAITHIRNARGDLGAFIERPLRLYRNGSAGELLQRPA
jgi:hypothetical protein